MTHVLAELAGAVGTVTLDHERRHNASSQTLVEEMIAALQRFREAKARVVILRAPPAQGLLRWPRHRRMPEARRDPLGWDDPCAGWCARSRAYPRR